MSSWFPQFNNSISSFTTKVASFTTSPNQPQTPIPSPIDTFVSGFNLSTPSMMPSPWQLKPPNLETIHRDSAAANESTPVGYYQGRNPDAVVAVIDSFQSPYTNQIEPHGYQVTQILQGAGDLAPQDVQKINDGIRINPFTYELLSSKRLESRDESLTAGIELSAVESLRRTSRVLEDIAADPNSKIKTINQSQSTNRYTVFADVTGDTLQLSRLGNSVELTPKGEHLFQSLGLEPVYSGDNLKAFHQKTAKKIEEVLETSALFRKERSRHTAVSRRLAEKGVNYVISAGNSRKETERLRAQEIGGETFDDSFYANPYNVVVGAIDTKRTMDRSDDTVAEFSAECPELDFLASGVDIPVADRDRFTLVSGTSFSAPLVAGRLAELRKLHPTATAKQLQDLLSQSSTAVPGSTAPVVYER